MDADTLRPYLRPLIIPLLAALALLSGAAGYYLHAALH